MAKQAEKYLETAPWSIVERGFHLEKNQVTESLFSLGNEYCGVRGYMEEGVTAPSLQGAYFNGIYEWGQKETETAYKGIIRRGHYMVNAVNWLKTEIFLDGRKVDVGSWEPLDFIRSLDFRSGLYERSFRLVTEKGNVKLHFFRFLSMTKYENCYQKIVIESDYSVQIELYLGLDFGTLHFGKPSRWSKVQDSKTDNMCSFTAKTQSTEQYVKSMQRVECSLDTDMSYESNDLGCGFHIQTVINGEFEVTKHVRNLIAKNGEWAKLIKDKSGFILGYDEALQANIKYFMGFWANADIEIEGDEENQQGIRFCLFQLEQTYHGISPTDNIGAKGLTGEAYSGHAFWDTETYCLPFFLFHNPTAAKDLLLFRYNTLAQAKERAKMLDCEGACYPIATLNGYEACDLWQHASLQFQPSTGVAYGIFHYVNVSGDERFLLDYGMEMLLEICRFLRSRGDFSADGSRFGFYCVMGPDEFQMMVNHNCYTNYMAKKTFEYSLSVFEKYKDTPEFIKLGIAEKELAAFRECAQKMYLPKGERGLYEQHEGFFNLPHVDVKSIPVTDFPLYHHWSYDRIYRNDMIKQPDVLMFMLLYSGDFSTDEKRVNYEYYEPRTIHESSLSPSVHSILASEIGKYDEALSFFGFASRLDLDDYNRNTNEGLHTTSIAAAWLNIVYGFGGVRSDGEILIINPTIPPIWKSYSFRLNYRGCLIDVRVCQEEIKLTVSDGNIKAIVCGTEEELKGERIIKR